MTVETIQQRLGPRCTVSVQDVKGIDGWVDVDATRVRCGEIQTRRWTLVGPVNASRVRRLQILIADWRRDYRAPS